MSHLLSILLALISVALFVPASCTQSHGPPPGNYRTPVQCRDCMSVGYKCWAVDKGPYAFCDKGELVDTKYAECGEDEQFFVRDCGPGTKWDDNTKTCGWKSTCFPDEPNYRTPVQCEDCMFQDYTCRAVEPGTYSYCDEDRELVEDKYAQCEHGELLVRDCSAGTVWDDNNKNCLYESSCEGDEASPGFVTLEISQSSVLYGVAMLVVLLLVINISCLCYFNCIKPRKMKKKVKYSKVDMIASSDDDMQHLKRMQI